jgi:hypothetical protein
VQHPRNVVIVGHRELLRGNSLERAIVANGVAPVGLGMEIRGFALGTPNEDLTELRCWIDTFHVHCLSLTCAAGSPFFGHSAIQRVMDVKAGACLFLAVHSVQIA